MRLLACLFALAACQHADSAERSAEIVKNAPAPAVVVASAPDPMPAHEGGHSCGGACGASCNGQCGAMCGGGAAPTFDTPANASWTALHVTGMHCGGCARRIERELAKVNGVLGVKADYSQAKVEVAVADGVDAKKLVTSAIDGLGYRVQ